MLPVILGVAKAGLGIAGAAAGHSNAVAQARAQNEAAMARYEYQLKIRERENLNQNQLWATKLAQYDLEMKAADKAASRAYGVEDLKQSQRIKSAAFSTMKLNYAMAKTAGATAASGKQGRSAERADQMVENAFARNQMMIAENLLGADAAQQYREVGIADQLTSYRNRAFSNVAIAPTVSEAPLEPAQVATPSSTGAMIGAASSALGAIGGIMGNMAPDPGPMGGFGGDAGLSGGAGSFGSYGGMSNYVSGFGGWNSNIDYNVSAPLTSGSSFFGD